MKKLIAIISLVCICNLYAMDQHSIMRSYSTGDLCSVAVDVPRSQSMNDVLECKDALKRGYSAKEEFVCKRFLRNGGYLEYAQQNYTDAYYLYEQAYLGDGITKYSKALRQYFYGCARSFCASENIDQDLIMVKFRRRANLIREYFFCLCISSFQGVFSDFAIDELDIEKAIEFQKMALFYMIFEDEVFDRRGEPSLYERIQEKMEVLCRLQQQKKQ